MLEAQAPNDAQLIAQETLSSNSDIGLCARRCAWKRPASLMFVT